MKRAWIKVDTGLARCPKLHALRARLDWSPRETVGFLVEFWANVSDFVSDGVLQGPTGGLPGGWAGTIMGSLGFKGDRAAEIAEALVTCGFVDELADGSVVVHDWDEWGGDLDRKREQARGRMKVLRERSRNVREQSKNVRGKRREEKREEQVPPLKPPEGGGDGAAPEGRDVFLDNLDAACGMSREETARPCVIGTTEHPEAVEAPERATAATPARNGLDWQDAAERFLASYPRAGRPTNRMDTLAAFREAVEVEHVDPEALVEAARLFAAAVAETWEPEDRRYVVTPANWLRGKSYDDDPATWRRAKKPGPRMHAEGALAGIAEDAKRYAGRTL